MFTTTKFILVCLLSVGFWFQNVAAGHFTVDQPKLGYELKPGGSLNIQWTYPDENGEEIRGVYIYLGRGSRDPQETKDARILTIFERKYTEPKLRYEKTMTEIWTPSASDFDKMQNGDDYFVRIYITFYAGHDGDDFSQYFRVRKPEPAKTTSQPPQITKPADSIPTVTITKAPPPANIPPSNPPPNNDKDDNNNDIDNNGGNNNNGERPNNGGSGGSGNVDDESSVTNTAKEPEKTGGPNTTEDKDEPKTTKTVQKVKTTITKTVNGKATTEVTLASVEKEKSDGESENGDGDAPDGAKSQQGSNGGTAPAKISKGAQIGIALGAAFVGLAILIIVIMCAMKRRRQRARPTSPASSWGSSQSDLKLGLGFGPDAKELPNSPEQGDIPLVFAAEGSESISKETSPYVAAELPSYRRYSEIESQALAVEIGSSSPLANASELDSGTMFSELDASSPAICKGPKRIASISRIPSRQKLPTSPLIAVLAESGESTMGSGAGTLLTAHGMNAAVSSPATPLSYRKPLPQELSHISSTSDTIRTDHIFAGGVTQDGFNSRNDSSSSSHPSRSASTRSSELGSWSQASQTSHSASTRDLSSWSQTSYASHLSSTRGAGMSPWGQSSYASAMSTGTSGPTPIDEEMEWLEREEERIRERKRLLQEEEAVRLRLSELRAYQARSQGNPL